MSKTISATIDPRAEGAALAKADKAFETKASEIAAHIARAMGTEPTLKHWESVRDAFCEGYAAERGCEPKTAANRWSAVTAILEREFGLSKPRARTPEAEKKAEQRKRAEEVTKAALAAVPATATPQEILQRAAEVLANGDTATARALQDAAIKKAKEAEQTAAKAAKEAVNAARKRAKEAIAKCEDAAMLRAVCDLLAQPAKLPEVVAVLAAPTSTEPAKPAKSGAKSAKSGAKSGAMGVMAQALAKAGAAAA